MASIVDSASTMGSTDPKLKSGVLVTEIATTKNKPAVKDRLRKGEALYHNQQLVSPSGLIRMIMQPDGNLVLYDAWKRVAWATNKIRDPPSTHVVMQDDENLVLYGPNGRVDWASGTSTKESDGNPELILDDGGFAVIWSREKVTWATGELPLEPVKTGSDRIKSGEFLPYRQVIKSKDGRFTAGTTEYGTLCVWSDLLAPVGRWEYSPPERLSRPQMTNLFVATNSAEFGGMTLDRTRVWIPAKFSGKDAALVMQNDGRLALVSSVTGFDGDTPIQRVQVEWSMGRRFPDASGSTNFFSIKEFLGRNQVLSKGDYTMSLTSVGSLRITSKTETKYVYLMGKDIIEEDNYFLGFDNRYRLSILDKGYVENWTVLPQFPKDYEGYANNDDYLPTSAGWSGVSLDDDGIVRCWARDKEVWNSKGYKTGPTPSWVPGPSKLLGDSSIGYGTKLASESGRYRLQLNGVAKLVLYDDENNGREVWSEGPKDISVQTWSDGPAPGQAGFRAENLKLNLDKFGNLRILWKDQQLWSNEAGKRYQQPIKAVLKVQDDGSLVILNVAKTIWSSTRR